MNKNIFVDPVGCVNSLGCKRYDKFGILAISHIGFIFIFLLFFMIDTQQIVDSGDASNVYYGFAELGSGTNKPRWAIYLKNTT